ncbi:hypothetical protein M0R19_05080 [Candidatus Pacearchaeota archaeon]|jgi:hypothetical protein|nr:hypothetical protein [Candidatus Pacearchaeota archaeon]
MIIKDENKMFCGSYDVALIMHDITKNTYHATFFEEHPMPGPIDPNPTFIRLKSKMHHTIGSPTFEGALVHLEELTKQLNIKEKNIFRKAFTWDGRLGITVLANVLEDRTIEIAWPFTYEKVEK